jgi:hypothetical protein
MVEVFQVLNLLDCVDDVFFGGWDYLADALQLACPVDHTTD